MQQKKTIFWRVKMKERRKRGRGEGVQEDADVAAQDGDGDVQAGVHGDNKAGVDDQAHVHRGGYPGATEYLMTLESLSAAETALHRSFGISLVRAP